MTRAIAMMASILLYCGTALAQNEDAMARARTHFEAGRALYQLKNYTDAIREFSAGYELVPKPQFLVNIAQCYDKIADGTKDPVGQRDALEHARDMYNKFLQDAPPADPLRGQVAQLVVELERKLQALPAAPPRKTEEPKPAVTQPPPTAPAVTQQDTTPKKKSGIAKFWWIIPVAAVVVVGVSLGAYYGTRQTGVDCTTATFGCINAAQPGLIQY